MSSQIQKIAEQASRAGQNLSNSTYKNILKGNIAISPDKGQRLVEKYDKYLVDDIYQSAMFKQHGVSLKYMLELRQQNMQSMEKQMLLQAQFLQKELPTRLAHRVAELENLPYGLSNKKQIITVRDWYVDSFRDIRNFPNIRDPTDEKLFTDLLEKIYVRHNPVLITMAKGVAQLRKDLNLQNLDQFPQLHQFLDGFYLSRIGIRMLLGQHISLHQPQPEDYIGLINQQTSPFQIAQDAVQDARDVCTQQYGEAPVVQVYGREDLLFPYVPSHLHQMLFELIKNSIRAVHEKYEYSVEPPPPVRVIVAEGVEDITIKISDEGGGIPRSGLEKIFTYLYTTAKIPVNELSNDDEIQQKLELNQTIVAGYGFGLPISRLLARYFGGDLQVISMEGYGTDAYLHLNRLGNSQEPLP